MYQVPCAECNCAYIGETRRMRVKKNDTKNGIAVHAWKSQHKVDWDAATVKQVETNYVWRKKHQSHPDQKTRSHPLPTIYSHIVSLIENVHIYIHD